MSIIRDLIPAIKHNDLPGWFEHYFLDWEENRRLLSSGAYKASLKIRKLDCRLFGHKNLTEIEMWTILEGGGTERIGMTDDGIPIIRLLPRRQRKWKQRQCNQCYTFIPGQKDITETWK